MGPGPRVGSPKVAQLAAIARRHCLPHDCHFKCAIMAAGLGKKNAILRNSSRGCLAGRTLRLGFTRSLSLFVFFSLAERARARQPAGPPPPVSRSPSPSRSRLRSSRFRAPRMRIAVGPFTGGLRATGRDLTVVYHSLFAFLRLPLVSSSFLSSTLASSFSFSPNIFIFLPAAPCLLRPPPSPLCFGLTRLPLPTSLFSIFLFPLSALLLLLLLLPLFLALPTTPVERSTFIPRYSCYV